MKFICLFLLAMGAYSLSFAQHTQIPLYPNGVPNSKPAPKDYVEETDKDSFVDGVTVPTIIPYFPPKGNANGAAVVICPGGGYIGLSMDNEGTQIAAAFNKIGVTAFILKYRLPSDSVMVDQTIGPLQDAQRAIQLVRQRAAEWGIDTARVGIIGFSAGGHLASTAATHFDKEVIENKKHISLRPSFAVLVYPVITFGQWAHVGSKENLIGKNAPQALVNLYSNEKQVTPNTPPTFLVHAQDDGLVPVQNSLMFYDAMLKNKVKGEIHIYQSGGHGFGLHNKETKDDWFNSLAKWMDGNGWLKAK